MADKPTKSELAKLPGGADFDVAGATSEEFDKHFEILARQAKLASLALPVQQVAIVDAPAVAVSPEPNPDDIRAMKEGQERYFTRTTWDLMGEDKFGWVATVAKPADIA